MSAYYYSKAIIGCEIDLRLMWESYEMPYCQHQVDPVMKFCPECGKENMMLVCYKRKFGEDKEDYQEWSESDLERFGLGYDAFEDGVYFVASTDGKQVVAGLVACGYDIWNGGSIGFSKVDNDLKNRTKEALKRFGLWNESSYGLYAIQYCSY